MNQNDIIRMARGAGIGVEKDVDDWSVPVWHLGINHLERFAALVAAAERERCAQVCLEEAPSLDGELCAQAIRRMK